MFIALMLCTVAMKANAREECQGTPNVVCAEANETQCTDAAHAGCVWLADSHACTGTAMPCAAYTAHGEAACEAVPGCAWHVPSGAWLGVAVFVGVVAALVAVLCVARIAYTRYLLSRPPEPGMEPPGASSGQKRSLFSRLFAFGSSSRANADGYVPPAKNNTPPVDRNPVHVSITDDETHDGDGEGDGAPSSESAAVL